jgi:hypothetical protein
VFGYVIGVLAFIVLRSPILAIVLLVGLFTLRQQWSHPVPGYHAIPPGKRLAVAAGYGGLLVALAATLSFAHELAVRLHAV